MKHISILVFFLAMLCQPRFVTGQTLVADDDVPGVLVPEGYNLRLAVTGLNYPSNIAAGEGRYWVTESGYDPQIPPTVREISKRPSKYILPERLSRPSFAPHQSDNPCGTVPQPSRSFLAIKLRVVRPSQLSAKIII